MYTEMKTLKLKPREILSLMNKFTPPITCARIAEVEYLLMGHQRFSESMVSWNKCPRAGSSMTMALNLDFVWAKKIMRIVSPRVFMSSLTGFLGIPTMMMLKC